MDKAYLKALCEYAERKGYQELPIEDVLTAFRSRPIYRSPEVYNNKVRYPKMSMSYKETDLFKERIIERKEYIRELLKKFDLDVFIQIGGSFSLKYQVIELRDRAFHDIDLIILCKDEDDKKKCRDAFSLLEKTGAGYYASKYAGDSNFMLGNIRLYNKKYPINLIIDEKCWKYFNTENTFNSIWDIVRAKERYAKEAKSDYPSAIYHRPKDLIDIYKIYNS